MKQKPVNALVATVKRIQVLAEYSGKRIGPNTAGMLNFDWHASGRDGAVFYVDPKTGLATIYSWLESGHNGDHYDCKDEMLSPVQTQEILTKILVDFEAAALEHARREVKRDEEKRIDDLAKHRLGEALRKIL